MASVAWEKTSSREIVLVAFSLIYLFNKADNTKNDEVNRNE